jgi:glycosyltransferase involved in cell wall biosynthesis
MLKKIIHFLSLCTFLPAQGLINQKVLICGVAKDIQDRITHSIRIVEKIGALFEDYRVIIYENNSKDKTAAIITEWSKNNSKVCALTEHIEKTELDAVIINRLDDGSYFRPECIARARNIVLDRALSDEYIDFSHIIWMDMDFKIEPRFEGFEEIFDSNQEWDAVFAYGIDPYLVHWDWFAFRDKVCPIGPELLGNDWYALPHKLTLSLEDGWYSVYSAFGGCGIYKKESIKGCRYSALVTRDLAKVAQKIIRDLSDHPIIKKYSADIRNLSDYQILQDPTPAISDLRDSKLGIIVGYCGDTIWRMNSFVYKFPCVCEHVTFHASMIMRGHDKLFIYPGLIFRYGG